MAKTKKQTVSQEVNFVTTQSQNSEVELHSKISKKLDDIKEDYDKILSQISFLLKDNPSSVEDSKFKLDEIKVSLAFDVTGKLGFIIAEGEVGVEAGIEVTFRKK